MNIAVVGLGLIGGSICKALKANTFHHIMGIDSDNETVKKALEAGAIDEEISVEKLCEANLTVIALYPMAIVKFVKENADKFKKGSIVMDICGVKGYIVNNCTPILEEKGVIFIGTHPMAGTEHSGFDYSSAELFNKASFIVTPTEKTPQIAVDLVSTLGACMNFGQVVIATPEQHDRNIAYTSQLAHVVSNAYVKSPSLLKADGFSAGSFLDLTRVAYLNEEMWSGLFMCNKDALLFEVNNIIRSLTEYRDAMENDDIDTLRSLLRDGRIQKEKSMEFYGQGRR
ncbi:MAG: prephenate dehydrogenase [Oscillospiraceae bacterium]|nr:prephenate dehydrogenase [Oscillospiraceae bacterium]